MHLLSLLSLLSLSFMVVAAVPRHGGDHGDGDNDNDNDNDTAASVTSSAFSPASTASSATQGSSLTGDTVCGQTMCVAATVNGSETSYVLSGLGKAQFGWMAMGFGSQMANSPMVIMWINNGEIILSQRKAPGEVMPTTDPNPPRTASALQAQSTISATTPSLAFTVPSNSDTSQAIIYAYGTTDPQSGDPTVSLVQHVESGTLTLNLAKVISSGNGNTGAPATIPGATGGALFIPLAPYEKMIVAHAILCTVGFLLLLPAGVLLARYLRTFIGNWFTGHWIVQFGLAGVVIVAGFSLGIAAVSTAGAPHFNDDHKKWGLGLVILYFVQCGIGAFIHFVKKADRKRRPPQNYFHAVLGLAIIALSLYQVHSGFITEWPKTTGRDPLPKAVQIVFWVWVVFLPVAYAIGLSFLPKQMRQERAKVMNYNDEET